jgi:hypothetical protein
MYSFCYMIYKPCIEEDIKKLIIGVTSHSPKKLLEKFYRICIRSVLKRTNEEIMYKL